MRWLGFPGIYGLHNFPLSVQCLSFTVNYMVTLSRGSKVDNLVFMKKVYLNRRTSAKRKRKFFASESLSCRCTWAWFKMKYSWLPSRQAMLLLFSREVVSNSVRPHGLRAECQASLSFTTSTVIVLGCHEPLHSYKVVNLIMCSIRSTDGLFPYLSPSSWASLFPEIW